MANPNNKTVVMTNGLGRYLKEGDIVNLKCKMQSTTNYDPHEHVAVYKDGSFQHFLALKYFLGDKADGTDKTCVEVTDIVKNVGVISEDELHIINMVFPETAK